MIEWLREQNKNQSQKVTRPYGQHLVKIKDKEENLIEVIKYGVKVLTDPDMKKGKNRTQLPIIYAAAMHEIHKAFSVKRLLSSYGFILPKVKKESKVRFASHIDVKMWAYDSKAHDYIDINTAEVMLGKDCLPSPKIEYIAKERIDTDKN